MQSELANKLKQRRDHEEDIQHADSSIKPNEPCQHYQLDVAAATFGVCVCGLPKREHTTSAFTASASVDQSHARKVNHPKQQQAQTDAPKPPTPQTAVQIPKAVPPKPKAAVPPKPQAKPKAVVPPKPALPQASSTVAVTHTVETTADDGVCRAYKLDLAASSFGACVCGRLKSDHPPEAFNNNATKRKPVTPPAAKHEPVVAQPKPVMAPPKPLVDTPPKPLPKPVETVPTPPQKPVATKPEPLPQPVEAPAKPKLTQPTPVQVKHTVPTTTADKIDGDQSQPQEGEDSGCKAYKVDMTGATFGVCVCGRAKHEHSEQALASNRVVTPPSATRGKLPRRSVIQVSTSQDPGPRTPPPDAPQTQDVAPVVDTAQIPVAAAVAAVATPAVVAQSPNPDSAIPVAEHHVTPSHDQHVSCAAPDSSAAANPTPVEAPAPSAVSLHPTTAVQTPAEQHLQQASPEQPERRKHNPRHSVIQVPAKEPEAQYRVALFDFDAVEPEDLSFRKGDRIRFIRDISNDWAKGAIADRVGVFPSSFVGPDKPAEQPEANLEPARRSQRRHPPAPSAPPVASTQQAPATQAHQVSQPPPTLQVSQPHLTHPVSQPPPAYHPPPPQRQPPPPVANTVSETLKPPTTPVANTTAAQFAAPPVTQARHQPPQMAPPPPPTQQYAPPPPARQSAPPPPPVREALAPVQQYAPPPPARESAPPPPARESAPPPPARESAPPPPARQSAPAPPPQQAMYDAHHAPPPPPPREAATNMSPPPPSPITAVRSAPPPPPPAAPDTQFCVALHEFQGGQPGDLDFKLGERVEILERVDENWLRGRIGNRSGIFPATFVKQEQPTRQASATNNVGGARTGATGNLGGAQPGYMPLLDGLQPGESRVTINRVFSKSINPPPSPWYVAGRDSFSCSAQMSSRGGMTTTVQHFDIKRGDRSTCVLDIEQSSGSATATVTARVTPCKLLTEQEMYQVALQYGPAIVQFAQSRLGTRVGNGECWTLGNEALKAAGVEPARGFNFGQEVAISQAMPGDIVQFKTCKFVFPGGSKTAGAPDHTAVVKQLLSSTSVSVLEQNPNPVAEGTYDFGQLTSGSYKVFRPMPLGR